MSEITHDNKIALQIIKLVVEQADQLKEWKQAAGVEAALRREFLERAERAEAKLAASSKS